MYRMVSVESDHRNLERRKRVLSSIREQHEEIPDGISGMRFCLKRVADDRARPGGHLTNISSMTAVPYLAMLGQNVTEKDEEAIRLHQSVTDYGYYDVSCLVIETSSGTLGEIIIRAEIKYDNETKQGWLVQKRNDDFWNITRPTDLNRLIQENKEVRCLGVYLYKDKESDRLEADIFPVRVNARKIIALCPKENKGWMEMDRVEQPEEKKIKTDEMLRKYLKSPTDFFDALWTKARAKTNHKESTYPIVRPVAFDNHISGTITSYGYNEWGYHYGIVDKENFHKTHVMLKLTNISQSSFEKGIAQGATSSDDLCDVEICWLSNGDVHYFLSKEGPDNREQRIKKERLNGETQQWLASIIDMIHFSDV